MIRPKFSRLCLFGTLTAVTIALTNLEYTIFAAEATAPTQTSKKFKAAKGRLPPYYGNVVTKEQREKIYSIQADYREKIEAVRAQLNALTEEQQERIAAVLNDEQKRLIEETQTAAKVKRAEKALDTLKAEKEAPIEKKTAIKTNK